MIIADLLKYCFKTIDDIVYRMIIDIPMHPKFKCFTVLISDSDIYM